MPELISTRDNSFTRLWFLTVDSDCKDLVDRSEVESFIEAILADPRGWAGHGYVFHKTTVGKGRELRKTTAGRRRCFHLRVSSNATIEGECGLPGLSCADMSRNIVYINLSRWLHGAEASGLDLVSYRAYLILHEIGHLLARPHSECQCDGCPRPIMVQATIANDSCRPNMWPLSDE